MVISVKELWVISEACVQMVPSIFHYFSPKIVDFLLIFFQYLNNYACDKFLIAVEGKVGSNHRHKAIQRLTLLLGYHLNP